MAARLLGIDIGTTGVRAAVFDDAGVMLADASVECPYDAPRPGWAEIDPERWWAAAGAALGKLDRAVTSAVDAIAVVGQAPTAVLLGSARPAILWLDTRAEAEARALGIPAYYLGPKLDWAKAHGHLDGVTAIVQSHAYLTYRLTGELATDPSTAALCLPFFDLATRQWSGTTYPFPPIRAAHAILGQVRANSFGLREGTPVVAGGGDFAAATLGAGVVAEGEACLMLGTAGNLLVPRRTPGQDPRLINAHHVGSDAWLSLGGTLSGGAQEWLRKTLGGVPHAELDAEAARIAPGAESLLFLPYLQGERTPIWDTEARGTFTGLGLNHGRAHLWRALLEGIALSFVDCQEVLESDGGVRLREVTAANGGGKSALFRQILCDALGVPLEYTPVSGGTVAGAAMLAALGIGALASVADAKKWRGEVIRHTPSAEAHARYRALLPVRRALYESLKQTQSKLTSFR
ncbi:MAG: FGGY family carbohydrate kinase [Labilithrix sp.]